MSMFLKLWVKSGSFTLHPKADAFRPWIFQLLIIKDVIVGQLYLVMSGFHRMIWGSDWFWYGRACVVQSLESPT